MTKLWPEDPLGPPLTEAEMDRIITTPALREKLGLKLKPRLKGVVRLDDQLVTCQGCKLTLPLADTPFHDCSK